MEKNQNTVIPVINGKTETKPAKPETQRTDIEKFRFQVIDEQNNVVANVFVPGNKGGFIGQSGKAAGFNSIPNMQSISKPGKCYSVNIRITENLNSK